MGIGDVLQRHNGVMVHFYKMSLVLEMSLLWNEKETICRTLVV